MYFYFALTILAVVVLALSVFSNGSSIFKTMFAGIHEPLDVLNLEQGLNPVSNPNSNI